MGLIRQSPMTTEAPLALLEGHGGVHDCSCTDSRTPSCSQLTKFHPDFDENFLTKTSSSNPLPLPSVAGNELSN